MLSVDRPIQYSFATICDFKVKSSLTIDVSTVLSWLLCRIISNNISSVNADKKLIIHRLNKQLDLLIGKQIIIYCLQSSYIIRISYSSNCSNRQSLVKE